MIMQHDNIRHIIEYLHSHSLIIFHRNLFVFAELAVTSQEPAVLRDDTPDSSDIDECAMGTFRLLQAAEAATKIHLERAYGNAKIAARIASDGRRILSAWMRGLLDWQHMAAWVAYKAGAVPIDFAQQLSLSVPDALSMQQNDARGLLSLPLFNQPLGPVDLPARDKIADIVPGAKEQDIVMDPALARAIANIPSDWISLLEGQFRSGKVPWSSSLLYKFCSEHSLPRLKQFLTSQCLGVAILVKPDAPPELLYITKARAKRQDQAFDFGLLGQAPLRSTMRGALPTSLPAPVMRFFETIHNGITLPSGDGGCPLPVGGMFELEDFSASLNPDLPLVHCKALRVWTFCDINGSGDFLCIDLASTQGDSDASAIKYCHDDPEPLTCGLSIIQEWDRLFGEYCNGFVLRPDSIVPSSRCQLLAGEHHGLTATVISINNNRQLAAVMPDLWWGIAHVPLIIPIDQLGATP